MKHKSALTTEEFIEKANKVHNYKYNYSNIDYISAHKKINITCPLHGKFEQSPSNHIYNKRGCPKCKGWNRTTNEFIKLAKEIHGNLYNYSLSNYTKSENNLIIVCFYHGKFYQSPLKHLSGRGCPKCANNIHLTTNEFIYRALKIHNNKYNYDFTNYKSTHEKICIVCPIHGKFYQSPSKHLRGQGCSKCTLDPQRNHNGFKWKTYTFPDGRIEKVQGYEPLTLNYLLSNNINTNDIKTNTNQKPIIDYEWSGSIHRYFPDCYVSSSNTIVETKSTWTWKFQKEQNLAKVQGSLQSGYNIEFFIWDSKNNLIENKIWKLPVE
jgi:hypothetical protein